MLLTGPVLAAPSSASRTVLVYGDSLSAAYGLPRDAGWASLLETRLAGQRPSYRLVNASVSGETSAGGLSRLPAVLARHRPAIVILALGANDGLRGLPLGQTARNLADMARLAKKAGARVLLVGIRLPPNYGSAYGRKFLAVYETVAHSLEVPRVPSLLAGMETQRELFQADGLHPTAQAQPVLLDNVWRALRPMLAKP